MPRRTLRTQGSSVLAATLLTGTVLVANGVIHARPATRPTRRLAPPPPPQPRQALRVERAACGICGKIAPMDEAEFCVDCGLLVQPECFGGYCDACCQPRCIRCAGRSKGEVCTTCRPKTRRIARSA